MLKSVQEQIEELKQRFPAAVVRSNADGSSFVRIEEFPLPQGWNKNKVTLLLVVPVGYPTTRPNGFEVDSDLRLANGSLPAGNGQVSYEGRPWMHFCWQPGQPWAPDRDGLWKQIAFAEMRLQLIQ